MKEAGDFHAQTKIGGQASTFARRPGGPDFHHLDSIRLYPSELSRTPGNRAKTAFAEDFHRGHQE